MARFSYRTAKPLGSTSPCFYAQQVMAGFPADRDEKSVFNRFSLRITNGVNFGDLVPKASSSELISSREREDCLAKKNNFEMGDTFVGIMFRKISAHSSNFYIFVYLLKSLGQGERDIATGMEGTHVYNLIYPLLICVNAYMHTQLKLERRLKTHYHVIP